jgi:hypothetical protein
VKCNTPPSVGRVLLALLLLVESTNIALFVSGIAIEQHSSYINCILNPSGCISLCAPRLSASVLGAAMQPHTGGRRC